MRSIWKYSLELKEGPHAFHIPYESDVLVTPHIAEQNGKITLWCEVNTNREPQEYVFHVFGTGWDVPSNVDYLGSVLMNQGAYVWHVYVER